MLMMLKMVIDAGGVIDAELMEQESLLDGDNDWNIRERVVMDEFMVINFNEIMLMMKYKMV